MQEKKPKMRKGRPPLHGSYSLLVRAGELPENRKHIRAYLSTARAGLIKDLGPTEQDLTAAQIILIDRTVTALGIVRCVEEYIRENSVMKGSDLAPALQQSYLAYVNHIRLNLAALGIKTKAGEGVLDLGAYVRAKKDAEKSRTKPRKCRLKAVRGQAEAGGSGGDDMAEVKQIDPRASGEDISGQGEDRAEIEAQAPADTKIGHIKTRRIDELGPGEGEQA